MLKKTVLILFSSINLFLWSSDQPCKKIMPQVPEMQLSGINPSEFGLFWSRDQKYLIKECLEEEEHYDIWNISEPKQTIKKNQPRSVVDPLNIFPTMLTDHNPRDFYLCLKKNQKKCL